MIIIVACVDHAMFVLDYVTLMPCLIMLSPYHAILVVLWSCSRVICMLLRMYILVTLVRSWLLWINLCICYVHLVHAMPCQLFHQVLVHVMLVGCMPIVGTTCWYAHEPNLNVDQVPPNRALFVQPQLPMERPWCGIPVGFSYAYSPKWEGYAW